MRFTGATRSLGLGPLAPECSGAAFTAVAIPQDRALAEKVLKPQAEGTEIAIRLRMRDAGTCIWRGVWLEDGLRAAGVVALETNSPPASRSLTSLLDRRTFWSVPGRTLTQPGDYELVVADVTARRLNEALGKRTDLVPAASVA
jgi:c-di-GMP-specific phosphodiesterase